MAKTLSAARLPDLGTAEAEIMFRLFDHLKELQIQCHRHGLDEIGFFLGLAVLSAAETLGVPEDRIYEGAARQ